MNVRGGFLLCVWMLVMGIGGIVSAQPPDEPLILWYDNHIWRWTAADQTVTPIGDALPEHVQGLTISPDGTVLIYRVQADAVTEMIRLEGPVGGAELASDLWALNLIDGTTRLIAGQPEGLTDQTAFQAIVRSFPAWSPDGTMLAWSEGAEGGRLVVYDFSSGETRTITDNLPPYAWVPRSTPIESWTASGILVRRTAYNDDYTENPNASGFLFYQLDGTFHEMTPPHNDSPLADYRIVLDGARELLALRYDDWTLIDIATGQPETVDGGVFMWIARNHLAASLRVAPPILDTTGNVTEVYAPDGALLATFPITGVTMSPSGRALLTGFDADTLTYSGWSLDSGDFTFTLPWKPVITFWGARQMLLVRGGDHLITGAHCKDSSLNLRLSVDGTGFVLGTTANNIRDEPGTSGTKIGEIPAGDWFTVLDGPVCSGGIAWWRVSYPKLEGWTAEGQGDEYWLQPGCPESGCARG